MHSHFSGVQVEGMLSLSGKSSKKAPYIVINKRLVKFKALSKSLKKLYNNMFPSGAVCITLSPKLVDVNVEVDKSSVICRNEVDLVSIIEDIVSKRVLNTSSQQNVTVLNQTQDFYESNLTSQSSAPTPSPESEIMDMSVAGLCSKVLTLPDSRTIGDSKTSIPNRNSGDQSKHKSCTPEILSSPKPDSASSLDGFSVLANIDNIERGKCRPPIYSDDEEDQGKSTANISFWSELEKDLDSQELFSPTPSQEADLNSGREDAVLPLSSVHGSFSPEEPQKLENIISDNADEVKSKSGVCSSKQASICSWSQGNTEFKMKFISPEQIIKQARTNIKLASSKKREKSISPNLIDKRRKLSTPSPTSKLPKRNFTFNLHYLKESLLFKKEDKRHVSCYSKALKLDKEWIVLWEEKLFAFNPTRAQEINLYRKLMGSHSLKYGQSLGILDGSFDLKPCDLSQEIYSFLMSCPTANDPLGEHCFISEKSLAINGIRINKVNDGLFRVTNVCEDIGDFSKQDVIETLELIVQQNNISHESEGDLAICDYSFVRCEKVCRYLKRKAAKVSSTFASFEHTATDVMDLFSNTHQAEVCVHGNIFREILWEFQ